jgi:MEMO1 family protein
MMASRIAVRPSAIAGRWYPGSAPALRGAVEQFLDAAPAKPLPGELLAVVAPHAGYAYSGSTAGLAFAQVRGASFSRVVMFGPLHHLIEGVRISAFMTSAALAYRTPLGDVPVDRAFLDILGSRIPLVPVQGDEEHSLEIELPFLQVALSGFTIVPVMFGEHIAGRGVRRRCEELAGALVDLWDDQTLLVVSTDLTHATDYEAVRRSDQVLVDLVERLDVEGLMSAFRDGSAQACGATGLITALLIAQRRGARGVAILQHTTSGDVTGDKRPGAYTVGYLAAAVHG